MEAFGTVAETLAHLFEVLIPGRRDYLIQIFDQDGNEPAPGLQMVSQHSRHEDGEAGLTLHVPFDPALNMSAKLEKFAKTSIYRQFDEYTTGGVPCFGIRFGADRTFAESVLNTLLVDVFECSDLNAFRCRGQDRGKIEWEEGCGETASPSDEAHRDCRRLLLMVQALHKLGYEQLRIIPGLMQPGQGWKCELVPAVNDASRAPLPPAVTPAVYSTADQSGFFRWTDAADDDPPALAQKFVERFPEFAALCHGEDAAYVRWFSDMLEATRPAGLPYIYAEYRQWPDDRVPVTGTSSVTDVRLPPPAHLP